jgi:hypothetical protein
VHRRLVLWGQLNLLYTTRSGHNASGQVRSVKAPLCPLCTMAAWSRAFVLQSSARSLVMGEPDAMSPGRWRLTVTCDPGDSLTLCPSTRGLLPAQCTGRLRPLVSVERSNCTLVGSWRPMVIESRLQFRLVDGVPDAGVHRTLAFNGSLRPCL